MTDFLARVANVQRELKAPKGQYNSFGKYKYRSCEDILEAVKPIVHKNGLVLTVSDDIVFLGERYYVMATATLRDCKSGETLSNSAYARESFEKKGMDESQITGTASSYARKYALNGLFCIDDTKDADTDDYAKQTGRADVEAACECCGKQIIPQTAKDGSVWPVAEIIAYSSRKFGKILCADCVKKEGKK